MQFDHVYVSEVQCSSIMYVSVMQGNAAIVVTLHLGIECVSITITAAHSHIACFQGSVAQCHGLAVLEKRGERMIEDRGERREEREERRKER